MVSLTSTLACSSRPKEGFPRGTCIANNGTKYSVLLIFQDYM